MYYNTTNEVGKDLKEFEYKAISQNEIIIRHFLKHPHKEYSPSEVWINLFQADETPITSIRRSLNALTLSGNLIKTDNKKIGVYGRNEYLWKLNKR